MKSERADVITRYAKATVRHPHRALIAGISEVTGIRKTVSFCVDGSGVVYGELPDRLTRFLYIMEGIREYEPETKAMMTQVVGEGDTVLVVGAHIGTHAVYAKRLVGNEGTVVAFEPTPDTFSVLKANCDPRGIIAEPLAVTKNDLDEVSMTLLDARYCSCNSGCGVRSCDPLRWKPRSYIAMATSLDRYCPDKGLLPDTLVLDVENGEMDVLLGAKAIITRDRPNIIMECGDLGRTEENSTKACLMFLGGYGYSFFELDSDGSLCEHIIQSNYPDRYPNVLAVQKL